MKYNILINRDHKIKKDFKFKLKPIMSTYKNKKLLLEKKTRKSFLRLQKMAKKKGIIIDIVSGFRTHEYQKKLFDNLVYEKGISYATKYIAKPYESEHETGLALDFCIYKNNEFLIEHELLDLEEINWIHKNAYKYGFIIRYPKDKIHITKYNYEPWHIRYVGFLLAKHLYKHNLTLEEYHK